MLLSSHGVSARTSRLAAYGSYPLPSPLATQWNYQFPNYNFQTIFNHQIPMSKTSDRLGCWLLIIGHYLDLEGWFLELPMRSIGSVSGLSSLQAKKAWSRDDLICPGKERLTIYSSTK